MFIRRPFGRINERVAIEVRVTDAIDRDVVLKNGHQIPHIPR